MIVYLKGIVLLKNLKSIIIASQIGYEVFLLSKFLAKIKINDQIELFTHLDVKETSLVLYGFETLAERDFFRLLLNVSGIGPKSAMLILEKADREILQKAIIAGDADHLVNYCKIGRKTAENIVSQLKNKVSGLVLSSDGGAEYKNQFIRDQEVIDALASLGYGLEQIRQALAKVPAEIDSLEERVRAALRVI